MTTDDAAAVALEILRADGLNPVSAHTIINNLVARNAAAAERGEEVTDLIAYANRLVASRQTRDGRAARREAS